MDRIAQELIELTKAVLAEEGLHPGALKEDPWKYFNKVPHAIMVPVHALETIRARPSGIEHAEANMQNAYNGNGKTRDPIKVSKLPNGKWRVEDGNSTTTIAKKHHWKHLPVIVIEPSAHPH